MNYVPTHSHTDIHVQRANLRLFGTLGGGGANKTLGSSGSLSWPFCPLSTGFALLDYSSGQPLKMVCLLGPSLSGLQLPNLASYRQHGHLDLNIIFLIKISLKAAFSLPQPLQFGRPSAQEWTGYSGIQVPDIFWSNDGV